MNIQCRYLIFSMIIGSKNIYNQEVYFLVHTVSLLSVGISWFPVYLMSFLRYSRLTRTKKPTRFFIEFQCNKFIQANRGMLS